MIVVGGENLIDLVTQRGEGAELPKHMAAPYMAIPGGSPYNCALAIARQGGLVTYATPISDDSFGELLAARLVAANVVLGAPRSELPTSLAIVAVSSGIPSYSFYRQGTADRAITQETIVKACPADTVIFHIGSIALIEGDDAQAWEAHFGCSYEQGIVTSFDPNVRPALIAGKTEYLNRMLRMLEKTDLLKLSDEDLAYIFPNLNAADSLKQLCQQTAAKAVILTKGAAGSVVRTANDQFHVAACLANPLVDTVGAGDTFMGTILCELQIRNIDHRDDLAALGSGELQKVVERASKAAAINCEQKGCNPPYRQQLD